jgi:23S rRNA (uridine2552-2'-O)-methyltransferase
MGPNCVCVCLSLCLYFASCISVHSYPSRAVFKLQEIQNKYRLLRRGQRVIDLGASPGSWSLFASKCVGFKGEILGVDLNPQSVDANSLPKNVTFVQGDVFKWTPPERWIGRTHGVISDLMAPTSEKSINSVRSFLLASQAGYLASSVLNRNGFLIVKLFQGEETEEFRKLMCTFFKNVKQFKPKSSRSESVETFVIGQTLRSGIDASVWLDEVPALKKLHTGEMSW